MGSKFKVIVADDKKAANTMIAGTLQLQGFEVYQCTNALEALNRIDMLRGNISAIYMEGNIAKERSSMIIPRIRQINSKIKILVFVDDQGTKEEVEKLKPDFMGVLPINATAVADAVKALLISELAPEEDSLQERTELAE
jgi:DNA-binding NtrC family response regulator